MLERKLSLNNRVYSILWREKQQSIALEIKLEECEVEQILRSNICNDFDLRTKIG